MQGTHAHRGQRTTSIIPSSTATRVPETKLRLPGLPGKCSYLLNHPSSPPKHNFFRTVLGHRKIEQKGAGVWLGGRVVTPNPVPIHGWLHLLKLPQFRTLHFLRLKIYIAPSLLPEPRAHMKAYLWCCTPWEPNNTSPMVVSCSSIVQSSSYGAELLKPSHSPRGGLITECRGTVNLAKVNDFWMSNKQKLLLKSNSWWTRCLWEDKPVLYHRTSLWSWIWTTALCVLSGQEMPVLSQTALLKLQATVLWTAVWSFCS